MLHPGYEGQGGGCAAAGVRSTSSLRLHLHRISRACLCSHNEPPSFAVSTILNHTLISRQAQITFLLHERISRRHNTPTPAFPRCRFLTLPGSSLLLHILEVLQPIPWQVITTSETTPFLLGRDPQGSPVVGRKSAGPLAFEPLLESFTWLLGSGGGKRPRNPF